MLNRETKTLVHASFRDITSYLSPGDVMVFNDTRVIPARLPGKRKTGGVVEVLVLKKNEDGSWEALVRPGRVKEGETISFGAITGKVGPSGPEGIRQIRFSDENAVAAAGEMPLPPYIHTKIGDPERYQTVFSKVEGSAAAPTAGLHFTPELLQQLEGKGVHLAYVTLHIGLDTFRPVKVEDPRCHLIHSEYAQVDAKAAHTIETARQRGRRVFCVGTTAVRCVEAVAEANDGAVVPFGGQVRLFILPGFKFRVVDALVTNFHLPRSTLLMLVSAFAGKDLVLGAYAEALASGYRFFSFGDAMLIV